MPSRRHSAGQLALPPALTFRVALCHAPTAAPSAEGGAASGSERNDRVPLRAGILQECRLSVTSRNIYALAPRYTRGRHPYESTQDYGFGARRGHPMEGGQLGFPRPI